MRPFFLFTIHYLLVFTVLTGCALWRAPAAAPGGLEQIKQQIHLKRAGPLTAGVAKVEITPPVGTPLAGYSKRRGRPSTGIRDPLFVRALALSDGEDRIVLVSADLLLFPFPLAQEILNETARGLKIPARSVVLAGTHTHSGTGAIAPGFFYEKAFGRYGPEVTEGLKGRVLWAIRQAVEHPQPVRWGFARSDRLLEGWVENRRNPSGPVDPSVNLLWLESMEGKPLAVLVNAAAHPTLMDSRDFRFSGDYPGELARLIESAYPGAVCLFFNGAAGDLRPRDAIGSDPEERVRRFGLALAEGVIGLASRISLKLQGDAASWGWQVPLPAPQIYLGPIPIHPAIGRLIRPTSISLNLAALDQILLVPLSAELTSTVGRQLRQVLEESGTPALLLSYANGYLGYAVTPEEWKTRSYEAWMTWYGPGFGPWLIEKIRELAALYGEKKT